ncbi:diphthine synthase [Halostella sp. PRR32]|uniref:diphthine synthase n=1 Tax=Halostella sp. PRR32 TaxID=3098147 RepID=UPI002B1E1A57|nr:diphthine synthase [Halostella sp. PRR32]
MLTFIGLGLYDERSITVEGKEALRDADRVFAEFYTSTLVGTTVAELEEYHDTQIEVRDREGVERSPGEILDAAETADVAFLTAGDTMISTTHVDLRLRAHDRDIETRVVHGTTAQAAASALTGLQNYRFGKATTLPFAYAHGADGLPASVTETIDENRDRGLHTLVYLDIKVDNAAAVARSEDDEIEEYMTASTAAEYLVDEYPETLGVVVARAGSPDPVVVADSMRGLASRSFGGPLHLLVVPGELHHVERDALRDLADAPDSSLD